MYAAPWPYSGHVRKGVLNQRQLQEVTAVTTHFLQAMGTLHSTFTYKHLSNTYSDYVHTVPYRWVIN